jgi:hypothetical protein
MNRGTRSPRPTVAIRSIKRRNRSGAIERRD